MNEHKVALFLVPGIGQRRIVPRGMGLDDSSEGGQKIGFL